MPKTKQTRKKGLFGPEYYFNYELSWLEFNSRVLSEAETAENNLLERVKFIGIVCSNLDEFFQKRVGGLKRQLHAGVHTISVDGLNAQEQLKRIRKRVLEMIERYRGCFFNELLPSLESNGISIRSMEELTAEQQQKAESFFTRQLYPIITPLAVDESHPFPFISNQSLSFAIQLRNKKSNEKSFARIKIPSNRPRFIAVHESANKMVFLPIEDLIKAKMELFFPGMEVLSAHLFRVTRNASLERNEEEADDLLEVIEDELRERKFAQIVRLELDVQTPAPVKKFLVKHLEIIPQDVYEMKGTIGLVDVFQIASVKGFSRLKDEPWSPVLHPVFHHPPEEQLPNIFSVIKKGDFMVHHPYHSFELSTQRFIEEAAKDPKVLAIKQTLYRTSKDSPLMHALMHAAEEGKQVAVLVEIKARFDEERNILWAQQLENVGVHVAYGIPGLKIHTKLTTVVREEEEGLRTYCHIGTGNYHPDTAQLYEDLGLFTCDEVMAKDVTNVFNLLTGFAPEQRFDKLLVAPRYMRKGMLDLIDHEIEEAKASKPARIIAKMNSLEDPQIIERLYEASNTGVEIDLIVRGVCRLRPGVAGLSDRIRVHSVIGRFLEHSRLYYFYHSGEHIYTIGSADWMHRNLDARVEAITPIESEQLKKYLQFVLEIYLKDNRQRWMLESDGTYSKATTTEKGVKKGTHKAMMKHISSSKTPIPMPS
ncbi:MAG: polyphosphate kinase 1 [Bacteroidetes bacterium]|nr:polyphosphate kinase 1 [Bacteroidota bacterium]